MYSTNHTEQPFEPLSLASSTLAYFLRARHQVFELLILFFVALKSWLRDEKIKQEELGGHVMEARSVRVAGGLPTLRVHMIGRSCARPCRRTTRARGRIADQRCDLRREHEIVRSLASMGACERIKAAPMTFGYVSALRSFLVLWLATLPFVLIGEYGMVATPRLPLSPSSFWQWNRWLLRSSSRLATTKTTCPLELYP